MTTPTPTPDNPDRPYYVGPSIIVVADNPHFNRIKALLTEVERET